MNPSRIDEYETADHVVPAQHADQSFPNVLVIGTGGAVLTLGSVLLTALAVA